MLLCHLFPAIPRAISSGVQIPAEVGIFEFLKISSANCQLAIHVNYENILLLLWQTCKLPRTVASNVECQDMGQLLFFMRIITARLRCLGI